MELRHLRYFVAVAEEGSLSLAAQRRLHTAQPSLSRQIRDLEYQVGVQLMTRTVRGIELTPAGRVFLDHARLVLAQVETARDAARRAAVPARATFALGFLTGQEMDWLPEAMRILRDELPNIDVTVSSQHSPMLADALVRGTVDVAFLRREPGRPELRYQAVTAEPLVAVLPSDHRLAMNATVSPADLAGETFIGMSATAPVLQVVIAEYLKQAGLRGLQPSHHADNLSMAISLVASTRGVSLVPLYVRNFLPWSVTSRPLQGEPPAIELVIGYRISNSSPILKLFLSKADELVRHGERLRAVT